MRVVVTGASGTIGRALSAALLARGDGVIGISRRPDAAPAGEVDWRSWDELAGAVEDAGAVVHLAGAGIADKRWSEGRKRLLRDSRIETARRVVQAIRGAGDAPGVLVSGSAVGIYGSRGDELLDEEAVPGDDFLGRLCVDWEAAAQGSGVRTVTLRSGVVLAREGGALRKMLPPFRLGLGGPIGRGRQFMAWIHRDDLVGVILHAIDSPGVEGVINGVAPQAVTNAAFSKALGRVLGRPVVLRVPPFVLKLQLGEGVSVVTGSQRVSAGRIQSLGYEFQHPEVEEALRDLLRRSFPQPVHRGSRLIHGSRR